MHIKKANLKLALLKYSLTSSLLVSLLVLGGTQEAKAYQPLPLDWNRPYVFSGFFEAAYDAGVEYPANEKDRIDIGDTVVLHWDYPDSSSPVAPTVETVRVRVWFYPIDKDFSEISTLPNPAPVWQIIRGEPAFGNGDELIGTIRSGNLLLNILGCYGLAMQHCESELKSGYLVYYFEARCGTGDNQYTCANSYSILQINEAREIQIQAQFSESYTELGETTVFDWEIEGTGLNEGSDNVEIKKSFEDIYKQADTYPNGKIPGDAWEYETVAADFEGSQNFSDHSQGPGRYTYTLNLLRDGNLLATSQSSIDVMPAIEEQELIYFSDSEEQLPSILDGGEIEITLDNYQESNALRVKKYYMAPGTDSFTEISCVGTWPVCDPGYGFVAFPEDENLAAPASLTISQAGSFAESRFSAWKYYDPGLYKLEFSVYEDFTDTPPLIKQDLLLFQVALNPEKSQSTLRFDSEAEVLSIENGETVNLNVSIATVGAAAARITQYYRPSANDSWIGSSYDFKNITIGQTISYGSSYAEILTVGPVNSASDLAYSESGEYKYVLEVHEDDSYNKLLAKSFVRLQVGETLGSQISDLPTPLFIVSPGGGFLYPETEFFFDASASYDLYDSNLQFNDEAGALNLQYKWEFGDGHTTEYSSDPTTSYEYSSPGNYAVKLTVKDSEGKEASKTLQGTERVRVLDQNLGPQNGQAAFVMVTETKPQDYNPDACVACGQINSSNPIQVYVRSRDSEELGAPVDFKKAIYQVKTEHFDMNGYQDLNYGMLRFIIGEEVNPDLVVLAAFDENTERFMIWDDDLAMWILGERLSDIVASGDVMLSNRYLEILDTSTVNIIGDFGIEVTWDLVFTYDQQVAAVWKNAAPQIKIATVDDWGVWAPDTCQLMFYDVAEVTGISYDETKGLSMTASWADVNGDGHYDLYLARGYNLGSGEPGDLSFENSLYINNGDGTFTDMTKTYGVGGSPYAYTNHAVFVDINNDGYKDLFVANLVPLWIAVDNNIPENELQEGRTNKLYINNGNGSFTDMTEEYLGPPDYLNSTSVAFADIDNDGDLDLLVTNQAETYGTHEIPGPNILYTNNYPSASFSKAVSLPGYKAIQEAGGGPAVFVDYDLDGDPDLFVAWKCDGGVCDDNDTSYNVFFENTANGFVDKTSQVGLFNPSVGRSMDFAFADYNNDGYPDLFISNNHQRINKLYKNTGKKTFVEVTAQQGLPVTDTTAHGQNASFIDYDNDGDLDLFVTNIDGQHRNYLYENQGYPDFKFEDVTVARGIIDIIAIESGGHTWADYDNDGDLDLFIASFLAEEGQINDRLYRNNQIGCRDNSYLKVELKGARDRSASASNLDSIGALVSLETASGKQSKQVSTESSYAQQSAELEFGLGTDTVIDRLTIKWPSGISKVFENLKTTNQKLIIEEIEQLNFSQTAFGAYDSQAVAVGDLNNDGLLDIVIGNRGNQGSQNFLYENLGNGQFREYPRLGQRELTGAINLADLDNDGDLDVLVGNKGQNYIYRNEGKFEFTEIPLGKNEADTFSLIPFDLNADGILDILEINFDGSGNHLYLGQKGVLDRYEFQESALGKYKASSACTADFDQDGDTDVFLTTYAGTNVLFSNDQGKLVESNLISMDRGDYTSCAWGDYNNDGYLDLAVAGINGTPLQVFENKEGNSFELAYTGYDLDVMGLSWADFNHNGYLDLIASAVNGDRSYIYLGDGNSFVQSTFYESNSDLPAIALADLDNDGDLDIVAVTSGGDANLIFFNQENSRNFLKIMLYGTSSEDGSIGSYDSSNTLGAKIEISPASSVLRKTWLRSLDANSGRSNLSLHPVHFGLSVSDKYDISVTFPNGKVIDKSVNAKLGALSPADVGIQGYVSIDEAGNVSGI